MRGLQLLERASANGLSLLHSWRSLQSNSVMADRRRCSEEGDGGWVFGSGLARLGRADLKTSANSVNRASKESDAATAEVCGVGAPSFTICPVGMRRLLLTSTARLKIDRKSAPMIGIKI